MIQQPSNVSINIEAVQQLMGEKDMEILILRSRVKELQDEVKALIDDARESEQE